MLDTVHTKINLSKPKPWQSNLLHYEDQLLVKFKGYDKAEDVYSFYRGTLKIHTNYFKPGDVVDRVDFSNLNQKVYLYQMDHSEHLPIEILEINSGVLKHAPVN